MVGTCDLGVERSNLEVELSTYLEEASGNLVVAFGIMAEEHTVAWAEVRTAWVAGERSPWVEQIGVVHQRVALA